MGALVYLAGSESRYAPCLASDLLSDTGNTRERQTDRNHCSVERSGSPSVCPAMNISSVPFQTANRIVRHTEYSYSPGYFTLIFTSHQDRITVVLALLHNTTHPVSRTGAPPKSLHPPSPVSPSLLSSDICYPRWDGISSRE